MKKKKKVHNRGTGDWLVGCLFGFGFGYNSGFGGSVCGGRSVCLHFFPCLFLFFLPPL